MRCRYIINHLQVVSENNNPACTKSLKLGYFIVNYRTVNVAFATMKTNYAFKEYKVYIVF